MTKPTSFRLSDEANDALALLARCFHSSRTAVLEFLILDRHSVSNMQRNKARMDEALSLALELHSNNPRKMFHTGYKAGWTDFQTRHADDADDDTFVLTL